MSTPEKDYTLKEAALAIRMSDRWLREQIKVGEKGDGPFVEHTKRGHKILFTEDQLEKLRRLHAKAPAVTAESITTGKKRRAS
jgi:hypothetical protein